MQMLALSRSRSRNTLGEFLFPLVGEQVKVFIHKLDELRARELIKIYQVGIPSVTGMDGAKLRSPVSYYLVQTPEPHPGRPDWYTPS